MPLFRMLEFRPEKGRQKRRNHRRDCGDEEDDEPSSLTRLCLLNLAENMKDVWVQDYAQNYMDQYFFRYIMGPFSLMPSDLLEELLYVLSKKNLLSRAALHLLLLPQLHSLSLHHSSNLVTANLCSLITARCQSLKCLNLSGALNVSAPALCGLLGSLPYLRSLSLAGTLSDRSVMATVAQRCSALKHLDVSRCTQLHPSALIPLAHKSTTTYLTSLLALDIGLEESEDDGAASASFLLLSLPALRQLALDNAGQACVLICKQKFGPTEDFTSKEGVASLQELWIERIQKGGDVEKVDEEDNYSLKDKMDEWLYINKNKAIAAKTDEFMDGEETTGRCRGTKDAEQQVTLKLGLQEVQSISLNSLDALGQLCPHLLSISVNCHNDDSGDGEVLDSRRTTILTKGLAKWSGQLRCLSLQFPGPLSVLVSPLQATGSSLMSVTLEGVRADGHLPFLELIRACPKLTTLTIHIDPPRSNQEEVEEDDELEDWDLPCLPQLSSLTLNFFLDERQLKPVLCWRSLKGVLWALLRGAPQLQMLSLIATPCQLDPVFRLVLDHQTKPLGASDQPPLRSLRHVNLKRSDITMKTAARLVNTCSRLSSLDLSGCWSMKLSDITKLQGKARRRHHKLQITWT